jgi:hypothetical protein
MIRAAAWPIALVVSVVPARADIVLHEFIPEDPVEDLRLGATTGDGSMSAAIQTENGAVGAPDMTTPGSKKVYGGSPGARANGSSYRVDSNTSQPDVSTTTIRSRRRSHRSSASSRTTR